MAQIKFNENARRQELGALSGLGVAYLLAIAVLYQFDQLDSWYLRLCGLILVTYLTVMPLYTIWVTRKMKQIDLIKLDYSTVLEHFLLFKNALKRTERISFVASPVLFVAALAVLSKATIAIDLFHHDFPIPMVVTMVLCFGVAVFFNHWAFKTREKQFQSVKELMEEGQS